MTRTFSRNVYGMIRNHSAATYYEEPVTVNQDLASDVSFALIQEG